MNTKQKLLTLALAAGFATGASGQLIISQYVETNSGYHPKGIELWNAGPSTIDFSVTELAILKGTNGGALSSVFTLDTGTLGSGDVMVFSSDNQAGDQLFDYMATNFPSVPYFSDSDFNHNGDDSFQIQLDSVVQDTFGDPGDDPGTAWSGNGVSTANQNIQLLEGIVSGDLDGWTDPSTRFETVSTSPSSGGSELAGFGVAPVPEPETFGAIAGVLALGLAMVRRRRRA